MDNHRPPGDIAGGEDMRRGRPQILVHMDVPTPVRLHGGPVEVQPGCGSNPARGNHSERGVDAPLPAA